MSNPVSELDKAILAAAQELSLDAEPELRVLVARFPKSQSHCETFARILRKHIEPLIKVAMEQRQINVAKALIDMDREKP